MGGNSGISRIPVHVPDIKAFEAGIWTSINIYHVKMIGRFNKHAR